jgi:cytochrome b561
MLATCVLLVLVAVHVAAAFYPCFIKYDDVSVRMIGPLRPGIRI